MLKGIRFQMKENEMKASDYKIRPVSSFLFKGKNGTGKTIAACSKEFRPVYVFNCEGRFESVINYYQGRPEGLEDIEVDDYPIGSGYHALDKKLDAIIARPEYKTVVVSSLTSFIYLILNHLIRSKSGITRSSGQKAGRSIGGIPVNELEDYNAEDSAIINDLIAFFQMIKSSGCNSILEAHITPYEIVSLESGKREITVMNQILTKGKKAPAAVPVFFNEIWLFDKQFEGIEAGKQKPHYYVNTVGTATDDCKTSWGIQSFDWTDKDFGDLVFSQLTQEVKDTPREDPNKPKLVAF